MSLGRRGPGRPLRVTLLGINSQYVHSSLAPWCLKAGLTAYARAEHKAAVVEGTVNEPPEGLLGRVAATGPDLVGISCYIWNIRTVAALLPSLKAAMPDCAIVLGGPEVSFRAESTLRDFPDADFLIAGEGEQPLAMLADALCGLGVLETVPGLCRREGDTVIAQAPCQHQGEWPTPYCPAYFEALGGRIAYVETSRGCPYSCAFCLSGREDRPRSLPLERAYKEILLLANSGTVTVKFIDRTFNAERTRAKAILRFILHHAGREIPTGVCFHFEIAGDLLDEETLEIIKSSPPGLFRFEIGLQSMDESVLRGVRRWTDMALLKGNVTQLIASGRARVHLDLIAGLPGEDLEGFARGFDAAYRLRPQELQLGFLKLLHGSAMREEPERYPCAFDPLPPYEVRATPWLGTEGLETLHTVERALDRLHNSGRFRSTLAYLTGEAGLRPFDLFLLLGQAIREGEEGGRPLSLDALTGLVYGYLSARFPGEAAALRDLMLRDRLASTPTSVLPECLRAREPRLREAKRALSRLYPRKAGVTRAVGWLCAGSETGVVFCDYERRDPVSGLYPVRGVPWRGPGNGKRMKKHEKS